MIYLSESIERMLERIEIVCKRDIKKCKAYFSMVTRDGKNYYGSDTVRFWLEDFKAFKAALLDGSSEYLKCEEGFEEEAKISLMQAIYAWMSPFWSDDISWIQNDVYVQRGLKKRIERLADLPETHDEAENLLNFIEKAYCSGWGQMDEYYKIKEFRMLDTEEEFEEILHSSTVAEELTRRKYLIVDFKVIRVAIIPEDWRSIHKKKGIFEDYNRFVSRKMPAYYD